MSFFAPVFFIFVAWVEGEFSNLERALQKKRLLRPPPSSFAAGLPELSANIAQKPSLLFACSSLFFCYGRSRVCLSKRWRGKKIINSNFNFFSFTGCKVDVLTSPLKAPQTTLISQFFLSMLEIFSSNIFFPPLYLRQWGPNCKLAERESFFSFFQIIFSSSENFS